jgi:23S rRNA (adenine2503-C2)-methyltransferase
MEKADIRQFELSQLKRIITESGEPEFRAKQIHEWIWQKSAVSFAEMTNLPLPLRQKLEKSFNFFNIVIDSKQESKDGTIKYLFRLFDGLNIEGVLIPSYDRVTICISSQVGCSLGCDFCATALLGYKRNLNFDEIFDQVAIMNKESEQVFGKRISNIVLMGMGEPLLNYPNVIRAIKKISSPGGLGISPQRITISTAGIAHKIKQLADDKLNVNLAVSLNTANEKLRVKMMPITKKFPLKDLREAIEYYYAKTKDIVTLEYIILKGVNDSTADIKMLREFTKGFSVKINLIEYNPTDHSKYLSPEQDDIMKFKTRLEENRFIVTIRRSKGKDIDAACGQLAGKQLL